MDMMQLLKQAQRFQENLKELQDELADKEVNGQAGAGMVTAVFNGRQELVDLRVDPELVRPENARMLADLVRSAVNDGLNKARDLAKDEMGKLTGGVRIPGLF